MAFPEFHRGLTDKIVEDLVPKGGEFQIDRSQYSDMEGPGGVDFVTVKKGGVEKTYIIPKTDSVVR
ncbi:hypothetical protein A2771_03195 [Candidatus Woesebacteria bacterium RIFCSPHIGHO2_01_FULL_38_26b]|uniref:Uncharacterized protein n=1 Tax=Candidatus Woesebacteria bacterium RIFCSPHIGHO2_01_FULL_38_26b TaxID=1802491 RepID=A0A1F7XVC9_9BACT|nr:MAG: hypothetical protein A2771_03195 [Candidatus Woesebacteria bacterium RIFCSPHIGHO2_01_FULL_38_26b]